MRARKRRHKTPIEDENRHDDSPGGECLTVTRGCRQILPSPYGRYSNYSRHSGAPRPARSRVTTTGSRFPGSRVVASDHLPRDVSVSSGINGRQLSAYSCGGSRGIVRNRFCLKRTHRIPLVSSCEHHRSRTWHWIVTASTINGRNNFKTPAIRRTGCRNHYCARHSVLIESEPNL